MYFNIGDIAHWNDAQPVLAVLSDHRLPGWRRKTKKVEMKKHQEVRIIDVHCERYGRSYSGLIICGDKQYYLKHIPGPSLIDEEAWAKFEKELRKHPELRDYEKDYLPAVPPPPEEGAAFVLTRYVTEFAFTSDKTVKTELAFDRDAKVLMSVLSDDLLKQEQSGAVPRKRSPDIFGCVGGDEGTFRLNWWADYRPWQISYDITHAPCPTAQKATPLPPRGGDA